MSRHRHRRMSWSTSGGSWRRKRAQVVFPVGTCPGFAAPPTFPAVRARRRSIGMLTGAVRPRQNAPADGYADHSAGLRRHPGGAACSESPAGYGSDPFGCWNGGVGYCPAQASRTAAT